MRNDLTGQKFGRWKVIKFSHMDKRQGAHWLCECTNDGNRRVVSAGSLRSGNSKSCGCLSSEITANRNKRNAKWQGDSTTNPKLYNAWNHMKQRCEKDYVHSKKYYKDRGIKVCNEWQNYNIFKKWSLKNGFGKDLSLDRIDNDGNYEPTNCRWVDAQTQANNTRTNHRVVINNVSKTLMEWERFSGIKRETIAYRVKAGWKDQDLLNPPKIQAKEQGYGKN